MKEEDPLEKEAVEAVEMILAVAIVDLQVEVAEAAVVDPKVVVVEELLEEAVEDLLEIVVEVLQVELVEVEEGVLKNQIHPLVHVEVCLFIVLITFSTKCQKMTTSRSII